MSGYGIRVSVFFAALFLIYGVHLPYLPLWLEWRGMSASEIGIITSAPFFLRLIVTPLIAYMADRREAHERVIVILSWLALVAGLVLSQLVGFWPILLGALVLAIAVTTIMPLTETVAIGGVRLGLDYGRMRLWGSLTFIAASFAGGAAVDWAGRGVGIWLIVAGCAATAAGSYLLPVSQNHSDRQRCNRARAEAGALEPPLQPVAPNSGIDRATVVRLVRHPLFITFLVAIGTVQAAHAMFYTFGAIHWRASGLSSAWIGTLWAIGVATEVSLFAVSGVVAGWFGPVGLLLIGAIAAVVRWTAMSFDPSLGWLIALQALHGLTYGASHLGAIHFISRAVPESAGGTAQAFYATLASGVLQGAATLLSGQLYARFGGVGYLAMAGLAAVGLAAGVLLARTWRCGLLWDEEDPR
jgi:MFS transporter, PPP family, 3-phenylpropionic acid transporter